MHQPSVNQDHYTTLDCLSCLLHVRQSTLFERAAICCEFVQLDKQELQFYVCFTGSLHPLLAKQTQAKYSVTINRHANVPSAVNSFLQYDLQHCKYNGVARNADWPQHTATDDQAVYSAHFIERFVTWAHSIWPSTSYSLNKCTLSCSPVQGKVSYASRCNLRRCNLYCSKLHYNTMHYITAVGAQLSRNAGHCIAINGLHSSTPA